MSGAGAQQGGAAARERNAMLEQNKTKVWEAKQIKVWDLFCFQRNATHTFCFENPGSIT